MTTPLNRKERAMEWGTRDKIFIEIDRLWRGSGGPWTKLYRK
jgi:hypothetical protein